MAKRYRPVARDQAFLLPPDMRDWLPADHPVHLVIRVVGQHLDTSAFHALRRTGGAGTAGYDPDMMVMVLVWAYAHQVTSSRRIEQLCGTDVAFRLICGGNLPDHVSFARFRAAFPEAIGEFFAQVLALCAALGMGKLGVVALDGTKIAASASTSANRTEDTLAKMAADTVAAHAAADAAEDGLFGAGRRGDEVPPQAWSPRWRDGRIAAALADLEAERQAAQAARDQQASDYLAKVAAGQGVRGHRPAGADVAAAQLRLDQAVAAQQARVDDYQRRNAAKIAATGTGLPERPPAPGAGKPVRHAEAGLERARQRAADTGQKAAAAAAARKGPGPVRNITDPDSRLMPTRRGFIQGYNAQLMTSQDGLIIATRLTDTTTDMHWLEPMLAAAGDAAAIITRNCPPARDDHDDAPGHGNDDAGGDGGGDGRRDDDDAGHGHAAEDAAGGAGDNDADRDRYTGPIALCLADAGYCSEDNLTTPGPDRLIATGKRRNLENAACGDPAEGNQTGQATRAMAARLKTPDGIAAYRHRGHIAETPNGDIKHNKGFRQFSMRGLPKASAEWQLITSTVNLFKAISSGHLTHQALDNLATRTGYPPSPSPARA